MKYLLMAVLFLGCSQSVPTETIEIQLKGSVDVMAWGFQCDYNTRDARFIKLESKGTLTENWFRVDAQEHSGKIIVGGFNTTAITEQGVLCKLVFEGKNVDLLIYNLLDDLQGAHVEGTTITL